MTAPDLLEQTRMALAEAGFPEAVCHLRPDGDVGIYPNQPRPRYLTTEVTWKAFSVTRQTTTCLACFTLHVASACLADGPLVRDCGVTR